MSFPQTAPYRPTGNTKQSSLMFPSFSFSLPVTYIALLHPPRLLSNS